MTSGTRTLDGYGPISTDASVNDWCGLYYYKWWTGGDSVREEPTYVYLTDPSTRRVVRKRLKKSRKREPHDYACYVRHIERGVGSFVRSSNPDCSGLVSFTFAGAGFTGISDWLSDPWQDNDTLALIAKLHEKIYGSNFQPSVALAEARSGFEMITNAATKLSLSISAARKGRFTEAWKHLGTSGPRVSIPPSRRTMANIWAEYRWGWTPLMQDMYDGAVWVAHTLHAPVQFRVQARKMRELVVPTFSSGEGGPGYAWASRRTKRQIVAYLSEKPTNAVLDALNPASVAWELIPYSFVVDWFIPISTYLQVRSLPSQLSGTFVTTHTREFEAGGLSVKSYPGACPFSGGTMLGGKMYELTKYVNRSVSTTLEVPLPSFSLAKVPTVLHAIDAVALLTQKLRSK